MGSDRTSFVYPRQASDDPLDTFLGLISNPFASQAGLSQSLMKNLPLTVPLCRSIVLLS